AKSAWMSARGASGPPSVGDPIDTLSTSTEIVDSSVGIDAGGGVSTHPKFGETPLTVPPCDGVSIAPNGCVAVAFVQVITFDPSSVERPSTSSAYAYNVNVTLPADGRKLVSSR